jgi:8-oxo-dGTP diphosphatase
MSAPQFGEPRPGLVYRDRPAAFGLAARGGQVALVRIERAQEAAVHDLPGGALDPGETAEQAVVREFGEEAGLKVRPLARVGEARQFLLKPDGEAFNNLCVFFDMALEGEDERLKIEADHSLVWAEPLQALTMMRHDAHAWAITAWLRAKRS